ncbi:tRNA lysidine(34) synthetase TilS [Halioxenophilus sp. WMMB6]|uniref:tRNA lysidine(34) synthetase TilS n=1 Tax=Halioxenophilus sp. WMMB6 TaxID=3073815 RepID=UPI00295F4107|nr:tRNA lysidine(34) synthetase TilS [Halioxenophilus sp. WMMB6]
MSNTIVEKFLAATASIPAAAPLRIGFSGGLDSTVLLHLVVSHLPHTEVAAIHVNHGLAKEAAAWQAHCQALASSWQVAFSTESVVVTNQGAGVEDAARQARRAVFKQHLPAGGVLLLAHHQTDQVETLLLRLLRGSGPLGLAAMAPRAPFAEGDLLRPLLAISRPELEHYAEQHGLTWVEDPSNQSVQFDRNFLRQEIIPHLQQRWPSLEATVSRAANLCRESVVLAAERAAEDLVALELRQELLGVSCQLPPLLAWSRLRQADVLRHWLQTSAVELPAQAVLTQIFQQLLVDDYQSDNQPCVSWPGASLQRFRNRLYLLPTLAPVAAIDCSWSGLEPLVLPGGGQLSLQPGGPLRWQGEPLTVRNRQGGERAHPAGRGHSQTLKKLLQEHKVEPWLRERLPLLYLGDQLAAVAGYWVEQPFACSDQQQGYQLVWQPAWVAGKN